MSFKKRPRNLVRDRQVDHLLNNVLRPALIHSKISTSAFQSLTDKLQTLSSHNQLSDVFDQLFADKLPEMLAFLDAEKDACNEPVFDHALEKLTNLRA